MPQCKEGRRVVYRTAGSHNPKKRASRASCCSETIQIVVELKWLDQMKHIKITCFDHRFLMCSMH